MIRFLATASVAVIFAGALSTGVDARSRDRQTTAAAGETLAGIAAREHLSIEELTRINDVEGTTLDVPAGSILAVEDTSAAKPAAQQPYAISAATRAALRKAEVASMMGPSGDLAMWGAASPAATHAKTIASVHEKKTEQLRRFASGIISRTSSIAMSLTRSAMRFIGTPYVFGGTSTSGFDCSGYTQHVFAMLGISLPRTADAQFYAGHPVIGGLSTGDLVFFQTYEPGPSHVGIYIGGGRFIHSSSHGVMISALGQSYWASRYLGAKRVANLR